MTPLDVQQLLRDCGALLEGHFLLSSGLHSGAYVQCAQLCQHPRRLAPVAEELARHAPPADVVVSPAMGGLMVGHEVARALGLRHIFTERDNGAMVLRRGFQLARGERALVVEDVFTTGKSTREVFEVIRGVGAVVVGALSLVRRSAGELDFGVPSHSAVTLQLEAFEAAACPQCAKGIPAVKPGSRPMGGAHGA
jgi:orotate phosphoribosyltransferase